MLKANVNGATLDDGNGEERLDDSAALEELCDDKTKIWTAVARLACLREHKSASGATDDSANGDCNRRHAVPHIEATLDRR